MRLTIWAAAKAVLVALAGLMLGVGCSRSEQAQERLGARAQAVTSGPGTPAAGCNLFIGQLANGSVRYAVTFSQPQAYVEVFAQRNGAQYVATNIVSSAVANGDGTYTYSHVVPAAGHQSGQRLRARFYSYLAGQPGVFTPGPTASTWSPDFTYGQTTCATPPPSGCHAYITALASGALRFAITLPAAQQQVEVFVRQNGIQNVAQNIVSSRVANPDGTSTYSLVRPASGYQAGDRILTRFYSFRTGQPGGSHTELVGPCETSRSG